MNGSSSESRAHWQRTEGMVIFDEEFRRLFPILLDSVADEAIVEYTGPKLESFTILESVDSQSMKMAYIAAHLVSQKAYTYSLRSRSAPFNSDTAVEYYFPQRTAEYTHQGVNLALREGVESALYFPLNLLNHAYNDPGKHFQSPLFATLRDVSNTLRQPWFQEVCNGAALGANGTWEFFSTGMYFYKPSDSLAPYLQLDWQVKDGHPQFDLSNTSKRRLRHDMKLQNIHAYGSDIGKGARGTTSGCPVRHVAPKFTSNSLDGERLEHLATFYGKSAEVLTASRAESGIVFGLNTFADYLDRVASLQQGTQLAAKLAISQAVSL